MIFLAEAFTRPPMMRALAKIGFQQSYTYFTWRNTKAEIIEYITELAGEVKEYFRPNFFVNTPDILHAYLQAGGRPAFHARLVLAATLSPSYGIYSGFESYENVPRGAGSEEYRDSEKYEAKVRDLDGPLMPFIGRLNAIRHRYPVFERLDNVTFLESAHDSLLVYAKGHGTRRQDHVREHRPERPRGGAGGDSARAGSPGVVRRARSPDRRRATPGRPARTTSCSRPATRT